MDKVQRGAQRRDVAAQAAELQIIALFRKSVERLDIAPQHGQVGLEILRQEAAEHDVAGERHVDVVHGQRQMPQYIVQQRLIGRFVRRNPLEEFLERDA